MAYKSHLLADKRAALLKLGQRALTLVSIGYSGVELVEHLGASRARIYRAMNAAREEQLNTAAVEVSLKGSLPGKAPAEIRQIDPLME